MYSSGLIDSTEFISPYITNTPTHIHGSTRIDAIIVSSSLNVNLRSSQITSLKDIIHTDHHSIITDISSFNICNKKISKANKTSKTISCNNPKEILKYIEILATNIKKQNTMNKMKKN